MVLDGKTSQEYPGNAGVPQGSILGLTLFLLYINDLPDDVICNIAINPDDTTLYPKCDQACDLWQQLELAFELESDIRDTVDWDRKGLVDFNAGKTQLVSLNWSNNTGAIDVKMDRSVLEEKSSFKMLGVTFSCNLDIGLMMMGGSEGVWQRLHPPPKDTWCTPFPRIGYKKGVSLYPHDAMLGQ